MAVVIAAQHHGSNVRGVSNIAARSIRIQGINIAQLVF
jgi:hypothetical protein